MSERVATLGSCEWCDPRLLFIPGSGPKLCGKHQKEWDESELGKTCRIVAASIAKRDDEMTFRAILEASNPAGDEAVD